MPAFKTTKCKVSATTIAGRVTGPTPSQRWMPERRTWDIESDHNPSPDQSSSACKLRRMRADVDDIRAARFSSVSDSRSFAARQTHLAQSRYYAACDR